MSVVRREGKGDTKLSAGWNTTERGKAYAAKYQSEHREQGRAAWRRWYAKNKDAQRVKDRLKNYGLSPGEFAVQLDLQGGVCAICSQPESARDHRTGEVRQLSVDHDHRSGRLRGLLCRACNLAIGHMNDSVDRLRMAAAYLDAFKETT